jgi:hypothetical protein
MSAFLIIGIIVVAIIFIGGGIGLYFLFRNGSDDDIPEKYVRGPTQPPIDGCGAGLTRFGGLCRKPCPPRFLYKNTVDGEFCVNEEVEKLQQQIKLIEILKKPEDMKNLPQLKTDLEKMLQEIGGKENARIPVPYGKKPEENIGCSDANEKWIGGLCGKPCPEGYEPQGVLCKAGLEILPRDRGKPVGEHCPPNFTFNEGSKMCEELCKPGFVGVGDTCYPQ